MAGSSLSIGLRTLTITRRPHDDLLTGWGDLAPAADEQPVDPGRRTVARVRGGIPGLGGKVTGGRRRIAVNRRVVSFAGGVEPFARRVQPGPGGPGASLVALRGVALRAAWLQLSVAGALIGIRRQLVAVGGDLFAVGAALIAISARLLTIGARLVTLSARLLTVCPGVVVLSPDRFGL